MIYAPYLTQTLNQSGTCDTTQPKKLPL